MSAKSRGGYSRYIVPALYLGVCLWGGWFSFHDGLSRLKSKLAVDENNLAYAQEAVMHSPSDPLAYYARAKVFSNAGDMEKGAGDLKRAVELRPNDHFLWLELGYLRSQTDDPTGAADYFRRSVALAPSYAQPRWYLGHVLLSTSQFDDGFAELRRAATNDPALYPDLLELAAQVYADDATSIQRVAKPLNPEERLTLAQFLIKRGAIEEGINLFGSGDLNDADRIALVQELIATGHFREAYKMWSFDRGNSLGYSADLAGQITNGDFEDERQDGSGFNWNKERPEDTVAVSYDGKEFRGGAKSLRVSFSGKSSTGKSIMYQVVIVEPDTHYRLLFSARTKNLVTGGPPTIVVTAASSTGVKERLGGKHTPVGTNEWQEHALDFITKSDTEAVIVSFQRQPCSVSICPIFGELWLDKISLVEIT